jgi:branched-chain amino acid transport system substrate-binding protein
VIQSMTGPFNTVGKAVVNSAKLYLKQHGDAVAGGKIQLIIKDDATTPDAAKRSAQELIVKREGRLWGRLAVGCVLVLWASCAVQTNPALSLSAMICVPLLY